MLQCMHKTILWRWHMLNCLYIQGNVTFDVFIEDKQQMFNKVYLYLYVNGKPMQAWPLKGNL